MQDLNQIRNLEKMLDAQPVDELLQYYLEANSWDGSFSYMEVYPVIDLLQMGDLRSREWLAQFLEDVIESQVSSPYAPVHYDEHGNLKEVTDEDIESEAKLRTDELAEWMLDHREVVKGWYWYNDAIRAYLETLPNEE